MEIWTRLAAAGAQAGAPAQAFSKALIPGRPTSREEKSDRCHGWWRSIVTQCRHCPAPGCGHRPRHSCATWVRGEGFNERVEESSRGATFPFSTLQSRQVGFPGLAICGREGLAAWRVRCSTAPGWQKQGRARAFLSRRCLLRCRPVDGHRARETVDSFRSTSGRDPCPPSHRRRCCLRRITQC